MTKANLNPKLRVKFLREKSLDSTPIMPGNMLVTTDTGKFYWDVLSTKGEAKRIYPNLDTINQSKALETGAVSSDKDVYADILKYKYSTFDKSKFTVVGSPTITDDGIASGFSSRNHFTTPILLSSFADKNWSVSCKIIVNEIPSGNDGIIFGIALNPWFALKGTLGLGLNQHVGLWGEPTGGKEGAIVAKKYENLTEGDIINIRVDFNNTSKTYNLYSSLNNDTLTLTATKTDAENLTTLHNTSTYTVGVACLNYAGNYGTTTNQIDLKSISITVDGVEVFSGNKTGMDVIKEDNYTTVTTLYAYKDTQTETISYYAWSSGYYTTTLTENANSYVPVYKKSTDSSGNVTFTNVGSGRIIPAGTSITNDGYSIVNTSTMNISGNTISFSEVTLANIITSENKIYFGKRESANDTTATTNPVIYADSPAAPTALYNSDGSNYTGSEFTVADDTVKYGDNTCAYTSASNIRFTTKNGINITDTGFNISEDGITSRFNTADVIDIGAFNPSDKVWEISVQATTGVLTNTAQAITGETQDVDYVVPAIQLKDKKLELLLSKDGKDWNISRVRGTYVFQDGTKYWFKYGFTGQQYYAKYSLNGVDFITEITVDSTDIILQTGYHLGIGNTLWGSNWRKPWLGSIDLNSFKIYVDGKLVYQPMLKIPYTLSKTGSKIVNSTYRDRVTDMYEQYGVAPYYTIDEENKNFTLPQGEVYGMVGSRILYDSYKNGAEFYNLYMDGYLEQGGSCTSGTSVTLLKEFKDNNYNLSIPYSAKTASSFTPSQTGDWIARGYTYLG